MCVLCSVLVRAEVWPELNGRGGLCEIVQYNACIYFVNRVCINTARSAQRDPPRTCA